MALREILARFGFQIDNRGLKKAETGIAGVIGQMQTFGALIAGSQVVRGISNFVDEITQAGDSLGKTSIQLGLSGKELQAWRAAAGFAGVESSNLDQSFRVLGKNALLAQQGSKQASEAFQTLGVDIEDASGKLKPANQLAREAGVALGSLEDRTKAVGLAQQIFGRTGAKLLPLFKDGAEGLDAALAALDRFGGGLSDDLIPLAEASRDRFFEFEIATTSLKSQLAVALLPLLNQVTLGLSKLIAWVSKATAGTSLFKSIMIALGGAIGKLFIAKFGAQLLSLAKAAALPLLKFALLVLVIDDLIALFEGRGSVIGTFIDKIFGPGSAAAVVQAVKDIGKAVSDFVSTGDLNQLDNDLDAIFGPPGQALVEGAIETFDAIALAIGEFIVEGYRSVKDWISDTGSAISGGAKDFLQGAKDLASGIVDGIVEGIKNGANAVLDALGGVVDGAIDAVKKKLKIKSPSGVTEDEIGDPFVMGIPAGAMKSARKAARMTAAAVEVATATARPSEASAPVAAASRGAIGKATQILFQTDVKLEVSGGSPSDPQISKLRQGLRSDLRENRRATLNALTQRVEATT